MPDTVRIEPYKRYGFGPFYTTEYFHDAIRHIGGELLTRNDLEPRWKAELDYMAAQFQMQRPQLTKAA